MAVYAVTAIVFTVFLPLDFCGYIYFDKAIGRLTFGVYLYGFLRVFGGFIESDGGDYLIHYKNSRAKLIKRGDVRKSRIGINDLKSIEVFSLRSVFSFPMNVGYVMPSATVMVCTEFFAPIVKSEKDFVKLKSTCIFGRDDSLKAYCKIKFGLNLFVVFKILIKVLVKK